MALLDTCSDAWDCTRAWGLGLLCFLSFLLFVYAFRKLSKSPHRINPADTIVLGLSAVQTFLGFLYYGIFEFAHIALTQRTLKILQALMISWIFFRSEAKLMNAKYVQSWYCSITH
jgi:ABC-type long-subunit fatty acid transport system fused permease/ATPase subunit